MSPAKTRREVRRADGISWAVVRHLDANGKVVGTTVDTPCGCLGLPFRVHTVMDCPWLAKRGAS